MGGPLCLVVLALMLLPVLLAATAPRVAASPGWTNTGGGDHDNEDWIITSSVEIAGVHTSINTFKINSGVTVTVKAYSGGDYGFVEIHAKHIIIEGTLSADGKGYLGGAGVMDSAGEPGEGPGGGGGAGFSHGGGGGGFGGQGGAGGDGQRTGDGAPGGATYLYSTDMLGSGGGGGGGDGHQSYHEAGGSGGRGGGAIILDGSMGVLISGSLTAKGNNGGNGTGSVYVSGGGGGGSGGSIFIKGINVVVSGSLDVSGGNGGSSPEGSGCDGGGGGGGGGGRIKTIYDDYGSVTTHTESGGSGGVAFGGAGYDGISGFVGSFDIEYQDISPLKVEQITVDNPLVDRKQDVVDSGAICVATISIRISDSNGYDEIQSILFQVRDNNDSIVVDTQIEDTTVIDENTLNFTYAYNPPDDLPDDRLGSFDVNVTIEDIWGNINSSYWYGDGAALFTVDDLASTINFDPTNPYYRWEENVSGTISRIVGTVSADNVWFEDKYEGKWYLGDDNAWSKQFTLNTAQLGENVWVKLTVWDYPLDGVMTSSYVVNDNWQFRIDVRWEDDYELLPNENAVGIGVTFYTIAGAQKETMTKNCEEFATDKVVETIMLSLDGYNRTQIAPSAGIVEFFAVVDEATVKAYSFTLSDLVGGYGPPGGILYVDKWIGDEFAPISGDYWSPDMSCGVYLVLGDKYQFCVSAPDLPERFVGDMVMTTTTDRIIQVSPVAEGLTLIYTQVAWTAWRLDNNSVRMEYQDNLETTTIVGVKIYDMDSNLVGQTQPDNAWFIWTWPEAIAGESYNVVLVASHEIYGDFTSSTPVGLAYKPPGVGPGGITELFGMPIVFAAFASIILMISMGLVFDAPRAHLAAIAMALVLAVTWYMGWLPIPGGWYTVILVLTMAVLFALVKGRRRG